MSGGTGISTSTDSAILITDTEVNNSLICTFKMRISESV